MKKGGKNGNSMTIEVIGTGSYLPETIMTNDDLANMVDTSDEWIVSRTGIHTRYIAKEETTSSMAVWAAKKAIEDSGIAPEDIDLIIAATVSADYAFPSTACIVQSELGAVNAVAFDLSAACSGFIFALNTAYAYISAGIYKNALLIGAETLSRHVDWEDRSTCVLFGDGAGAAVVRRSHRGFISFEQGADGIKGMVLNCAYPPIVNPYHKQERVPGFMKMDGQEVFKFAVKKIPECIQNLLEKQNMTPEDVDWYLLHQANIRIIQSIAKRLSVSLDKFPSNLFTYGNTSAASVPILLDEVHHSGQMKEGDKIVLAGFGGGLTWGACLLEWTIK